MSQADLAMERVSPHSAEAHVAGVMEESPFAIPSSKLVMWLFIISDACTFGAMLFAYGYLRNSAADWPQVFESASIWNSPSAFLYGVPGFSLTTASPLFKLTSTDSTPATFFKATSTTWAQVIQSMPKIDRST